MSGENGNSYLVELDLGIRAVHLWEMANVLRGPVDVVHFMISMLVHHPEVFQAVLRQPVVQEMAWRYHLQCELSTKTIRSIRNGDIEGLC